MKLSIVAALALCAPSLAFAANGHLVGTFWKFARAPPDGLSDITFPMNIAAAPHVDGYYFAQQFKWYNLAKPGYTGLQPRRDSNGNSIVHGVFSSFVNGTTTNHPNCQSGADYGPGVSCALDFMGDYNHTYNLVVQWVQDTTWRGTLVNTVTGKSAVIGEWTLPKEAGKLSNGHIGFLEYYPWNLKQRADLDCSTLPPTEATFYDPISATVGASGGEIRSLFEYNYAHCKGKSGFWPIEALGRYDIRLGFKP